MTVLAAVLVVAALAYVAGRWHRAAPPHDGSARVPGEEYGLAVVDRAGVERSVSATRLRDGGPVVPGRLDKLSTVSHYEALASQVADERRPGGPAWCGPRAGGRGVALRLVWSGGGTGVMDGRRG